MVTMDRELSQYYELELISNMIRLTKGSISHDAATELAQRAVNELDWSNSALQHKGLGWIAGKFLEKAGYEFNYSDRVYKLNG